MWSSASTSNAEIALTDNYIWIQHQKHLLGRGTFGSVYKGKHRITGEPVAVKESCRTVGANQYAELEREVRLLSTLDSPYIVRYIATEKILTTYDRSKAIIIELADSTLRRELDKPENYYGLPHQMTITVIDHLERALAYLDGKKIAHRDIKSANVLIFKRPSLTFKLCDFGLSRTVDEPNQPMDSICGAPGYLNEKTTGNAAFKRKMLTYTKDECDNWSFACTVFECATGLLPFLTAGGIRDYRGMYSMLSKRPPNVICGHTNLETGEYEWSEELPPDGRFYPKCLKRILCVFFRRLFDRGSAFPTFQEVSALCREVVSLKRFEYLDVNSLRISEYFDTSSTSYFEKVKVDDDVLAELPKDLNIWILETPSSAATQLATGCIDGRLETAVMAVENKDPNRTSMPTVQAQPAVERFPSADEESYLVNVAGARRVVADIFRIEQEICELVDFLNGLIGFCQSHIKILDAELLSMSCKLDAMEETNQAVQMQSIALCMIQPDYARPSLENNAKSVAQEIAANKYSLRVYSELLAAAKASLVQVKLIAKRPSKKELLDETYADIVRFPETTVPFPINCNLLMRLFTDAVQALEETTKAVRDVMDRQMHQVLIILFKLSAKLKTQKEMIAYNAQMTNAACEINKQRFNLLTEVKESKERSILSDMLTELKERARQQRVKAEEDLSFT